MPRTTSPSTSRASTFTSCGIGNLGAAPPVSYEVLYTPGDAGQARLLAGILKARQPLVAPIDAATAPAIGSARRLVVVIP